MLALISKSLGLNYYKVSVSLYLHKAVMPELKPIQWFLEKWQRLKREKKKMKRFHSTLTGNYFYDQNTNYLLILPPKHLERHIRSSISKINQQDDFRSLLSRLALSRGHGGEMCCIPLTDQGATSFFTRRINSVKQRRGRCWFCLLPYTPSQLYSPRGKVMNAERSESTTKLCSVLLAIVSINPI